jgi:hypothetical protein
MKYGYLSLYFLKYTTGLKSVLRVKWPVIVGIVRDFIKDIFRNVD